MQTMRKVDFNKRAYRKAIADMQKVFGILIPMSYENISITPIQ